MAARSAFLPMVRQGAPLALGMVSHAMVNLVDLALVGRLGGDAVAGVHVATTVNFLPMIVGNAISVATLSMLARRIGAGRMAAARALSSRAQRWMLGAGLWIGGVGAVLAVPCVDLQGVTGAARDIAIHYLVVAQLGTVAMYALMQTTATMRALGESGMPLALLAGANLLNLLLDVVLLFGWEAVGIPAMGAPGAAYGSVLARAVAAVAGMWWIGRLGYPLRQTWRAGQLRRGERRRILALGTPQSVQMLVRALAIIAITRMAADLGGQDAVVALGVTTRLDTLVLFAAAGYASAATSLVGRSCGAGADHLAHSACRWGGVLALVSGSVMVAMFAMAAAPLLRLFVADAGQGVLRAGELYLWVAAWAQPLAAYCLAVSGGLNGAGRFKLPMLLDLAGYGALLLPALALAAGFASGLGAVWWSLVAGHAVLAIGYSAVLERTRWLPVPSCQTGSSAVGRG